MRTKINQLLATVALTLLFVFAGNDAFSQCAMCRATVESNVGTGKDHNHEEGSDIGSGLNTGILYLMAAPYVLIGTVGFLWYRSSRKKA